ncbi:MAG: carotenoid oxygenase family protein [Microthrixaceae bacterium]
MSGSLGHRCRLFGPPRRSTRGVTAHDLRVTGTIPSALDGRYLRNGPNPFTPPDPSAYYWFLGDGMVHGIRLRDGKAEWYRNRWVRSTAISEALGETPVPGRRNAGMEAVNTNVIGLAGRTFAIVEAGANPVELTDELDSIRFSDFDGTLPNGFTAHPTRHPGTGRLHAANYCWTRPNLIEYVTVGPDGRVERAIDIEVPGNPMVHDCSITEHHFVLYDLPVTFDVDALMAGATFPYAWNDTYGARVGVMPLDGAADEVRWFEVEPCYVFHPLNAYEDGTEVVLDVVRHPKMFDRNRLGPDEGASTLWQWRLDTATGTTTERQLDDRAVEFPRVDERMVGRRHRGRPGRRRRLRTGPHHRRGGVRSACRRFARGRRLVSHPRPRRGDRSQRAVHPGRTGPRRRAGRHGAPAGTRTRRLPRQLDPQHLRAVTKAGDLSDLEHLEDLVAIVVDDLHRDLAGARNREGS